MRWLVGWSSIAASFGTVGAVGGGDEGGTVHPVGSQLLWGDPDPLWAVGDWRPDEIRISTLETAEGTPTARLAVLGCCGATDEQLRLGLLAARGGALRHLTAWAGSYTAVVQIGRRVTVVGDLAGARPVFYTPWAGGTAYATAALPLADLIEAQLDIGHLAALLACPETPEALRDGTPYVGVKRIPPGHALILREGSREITGYEPVASLAVAAPQLDPVSAVDGVRDALVEAVRARLTAPRHAPETLPPDPGPVPGMGPAERRAARGAPVPGIGADLSGGSASATLALLAAGLPGLPGTLLGHGTGAGERLLAVTFNDLTTRDHEDELERAAVIAANPRLHHVVVAAGEEALPYADLGSGPLTDEPAASLVVAERHRRRLAAGSADHLVGDGARQVLDAHPARLADLLMDRRRRHLLRPVAALARAERPSAHSLFVPLTVYRAARRLARTSYRTGLEAAADRLPDANRHTPGLDTPADASLAALTWSRPGPAARWLTGEALAEVSVRLQEAAIRPTSVQRPGEARARAALARHAADHRILEQAAEIRSQRLHAPFLDNQVVRAARALPESLRVQPGARAAILRRVLAGAGIHELPAGWGAPSQATSTAVSRTGLRTALPDLIALFDAPLLADAGLIEARVVRKALRAASEGEPLPLDGLADLAATELWLRRLVSRRGTCWTGTAAPRQRAVAGGVAPARRTLQR
ncbi:MULTISPECIES: asparagine synthase-related protein [unclassified Streptomyces]|uniref:asparagine synthase-related protein n=1 Tax=unclassified Streptomyces TaxID=2593676 RepID=UPI002DDA253F|nr:MULTISPECIES: asparagine synthase-related protein [unclassified Streptomyces]WSF85848.1 asparagine synthase-related protein [Streptomyces sp. NBC_01744]WSC37866.1 asparagine synthase-related protein [Streptomyces sp. NBC_01763]WSC55013.1 asparagine synthase-related protein [Streptomyces sp. NBC_01761]WSD25644.1 asparagine synthase-related protein [Streptomyces sp. NBC_01751]WSJ52397.1 asparagine synthase-related protein [Streptomyces sp. NBC_01318]